MPSANSGDIGRIDISGRNKGVNVSELRNCGP